jgi:hypothetical protein
VSRLGRDVLAPVGTPYVATKKWNERRGESTWGAQTIERALAGKTDFYTPPPTPPTVTTEAKEAGAADESKPIRIVTLGKFLELNFPPAESLIGQLRDGTNPLPRFGWVMPWGPAGSTKTSILVDLLFHAGDGRQWQDYPILRPLRIVAIVNEGISGGLQDKLREKVELWDGDAPLETIAFYTSPWGEFTFRNDRMFRHLQDYARDFQADYFAGDPLHTLGAIGTGTPQETAEFKHLLRRFGVWDWIGIITSHHSNKNGMVSGD